MMYSFMTLNDKTEIVHSEMKEDGRVKVYIERPTHLGFNSVQCYLPGYEWSENNGFNEEELEYFKEFVQSLSHVIIDLAREGGFENASNL